MRSRRVLILACAAMTLVSAGHAVAVSNPTERPQFGVRTGIYTDASAAFLGAEVLTPIAHAWYFDPNLEYAATGDIHILTVNGDFHYDFVAGRPYYVWAGAGPAVVVREDIPGDRRSDMGVNVLGGVGWKRPQVTPFVQTKVTLSRVDEAVLVVGLRF